jgi:hypothetical protein
MPLLADNSVHLKRVLSPLKIRLSKTSIDQSKSDGKAIYGDERLEIRK